jgi:formylglycine-generating enzyme required for sulfatase activity
VQVTYGDALGYCAWAGLELPTEAQWERAAGWDDKEARAHRFTWGDGELGAGSRLVENSSDESVRSAHSGPGQRNGNMWWWKGYDDKFAWLAPVGSFPEGATPCGALDMGGNASEWCGHVGRYHEGEVVDPPVRPGVGIVRGGSWSWFPRFGAKDETGHMPRVSYRANHNPSFSSDAIGFRVALSLAGR